MKRFINWLLGKKELTIEVHFNGNFRDVDIKSKVKLWDKIRKEHSCNCTLFFDGL